MSPQPFVIIWVWATRMPVTGNSPNSVKCHQARGRCTATITLSSFCAVKATIALPGASHREPKRRNRGIYRNGENSLLIVLSCGLIDIVYKTVRDDAQFDDPQSIGRNAQGRVASPRRPRFALCGRGTHCPLGDRTLPGAWRNA